MMKRFATTKALPLLALLAILAAVPAMAMKIEIDKGNYACAGDSMTVTVTDNTLPLPAQITVTVEAFDEFGVLLDTETVGNFVQIPDPVDQIFESGPLPLSDAGTPAAEDGVLNGRFAGTTTATYFSGGMILATTANFCRPTEVAGTAGGTTNGVSWSATITGSIDYDAGIGTVVIGPTPNDTICKGMEAFTGLGTFAGTMASIVLGQAQGPGELTRGNFTRRLAVTDSRSDKAIEYEHVVTYSGSGNRIDATLTLGGEIDAIDPNLTVEHDPWDQFFIPDGSEIALSQTQKKRLVGLGPPVEFEQGPSTLPPVVVLDGFIVMGSITPTGLVAVPPLAQLQVRRVDQISVECDAVADTLTIISRNTMAIVPATPALSTWGIVVLAVLILSAFLALRHRDHAAREALDG